MWTYLVSYRTRGGNLGVFDCEADDVDEAIEAFLEQYGDHAYRSVVDVTCVDDEDEYDYED